MTSLRDANTRHRLLVLLLFAGSGVAALVYEVVWLQMLQLVVGSSTVSVGVLLGTFMGGLCLGSAGFTSVINRQWHPLRVYAALEVIVAACAVALLPLLPALGGIYFQWNGAWGDGIAARSIVAALCLLPPTLAMGATLPAIGRWVEASPRGVAWLGLFYAGNTLGAVAGALLSAFYLLRVFDVTIATGFAAAVNLAVAAVAWRLASSSPQAANGYNPVPAQPAASPRSSLRVLLVAALSGFAALAAEVVWTRYLSLTFGATVYSFAIILAVFLASLGCGSAGGAWLAARVRRPAAWLAVIQLATVAGVAYSAWMMADVLPRQPASPAPGAVWRFFLYDLWRAALALWPAPLLWGATFPLALAAIAAPRRRGDGEQGAPATAVGEMTPAGDDAGRLAGRVYAANTVGAIVGALSASLVLIAAIGTQRTQQVIMAAGALAAVLAGSGAAIGIPQAAGRLLAAAAVLVGGIAAVPPVPAMLVAYGRHAAAWAAAAGEMMFVGEGLQASVAVSRAADGALHYHNAGKVQASSLPQDMRLQRMLGHLTTLVPHQPRKVLVIGCGAGVTAGAVSVSPAVERVTIVEIEPLVPRAIAPRFAGVNHDVIANPKVVVHIDDARHFLATTRERFDAITSDPLDPWVRGAAALYTREFFELARDRLTPGGVMTLFVQLYESSPAAVKSEIATFFEAFPDGLIFGNVFDGRAEDTVLVGGREPLRLDVDALEARYLTAEYARVRRSLGEIGIYSIVDLFGQYLGRASDLHAWLADAELTRDRNLRLQYLAGISLNQHLGRDIYRDLVQFRRFPEDVFVASEPNLSWLRTAIEQPVE